MRLSSVDSYAEHVVDNQPPTLTCPQSFTSVAPKGSQQALVNWKIPPVTDNSGKAVSVIQSPMPPATLSAGTYSVSVSAFDASSQSASCTFQVTVKGNLVND